MPSRNSSKFVAARALGLATLLLLAGSVWGQAGEQADTGGEEVQRFDIWEFQLTGNTVLEVRDIERAVYPMLGPDRSIDDVIAAQQALETLYRDAGFGAVLVNIPEQNVEAGVVQLEIVEGRIGRLRVSGADYFSPRRIKEQAPSLAEGNVLYLPDVQDDLTELNKASRDRTITPVLRPGRDPGTVEVDLKVEDSSPVHGFVEVNDRYTRDTSRSRINASLTYGNLWQKEHSASLGYQTAPDNRDEVEALYGTYLFRIPNTEWITTLYGVKTDSDVATFGTLGVIGDGTILGLRASRPLGLIDGVFHNIVFGIDYKDFDESVLLAQDPDQETPVDYWVASAAYSFSITGENRFTRFGAEAIVAPRFLNSQDQFFELEETETGVSVSGKRVNSRANFSALRLRFNHRQQIGGDSELRFRLVGQLADSPLINNEQFSYGGIDTVRGYLEAQQFADDGIAGQIELFSPDWGQDVWGEFNARFLAFFDAGFGRVQDSLPGTQEHYELYSVGVGLRMALWGKLTGALDWAKPFEDSEDRTVDSGEDRLHFQVGYEF